jgi:hypothetical protein
MLIKLNNKTSANLFFFCNAISEYIYDIKNAEATPENNH